MKKREAKRFQRGFITFVLLLCLGGPVLLSPQNQARADDPTPTPTYTYDWYQHLDFTVSNGGYSLWDQYCTASGAGEWLAGYGWHTTNVMDAGTYDTCISIKTDPYWPAGLGVRHLRYTYNVLALGENGNLFTNVYSQDCETLFIFNSYPISSTGVATIDWYPTTAAGCLPIVIRFWSYSGYSGNAYLTDLEIWGTGTNPYITPTPTLTPTSLYTPAFTGTPGAGVTNESCPTLGDENALFQFDMEWAGYYTEFYDTTNLVSLVLHPGSFATLDTTLKASRRYSWQMVFMTPAAGATGPLNLGAGDQDFAIELFNDTSDHTLTNQAINLGTEPIELRLDRPTTATGDVVIRYLCFTAEGDSVKQPTDSETGKADDCMLCDPPLSIADVIGLLNWLVCNIRNVIICVIIPALGEVLKYIVLGVQYALSFFTWLVQGASDAVTWVADLVLGFFQNLGGQVSNAIFGSNNALITSGAAGLLNQTAGMARDLPTILANEANRLNTDLQAIFENAQSLPEMVINLIGLAANVIMSVLGLIPLALQALFDGLASSAESVSGGLMCSTPDTALYFPCLGFYILDNTFFQGPARFLIPVLMGVVMLDMLTWAIAAIREAFVK